MTVPVTRSIVCPMLIGRAASVDALHRLVDETRQGRGQTALIAGDAGVGKTRLTAEARAYAQAHGFRPLQGNCFPADSACPYAPLLDLMRAHFTSAADLGPDAGALYPLLPDLAPPPDEASPLPPLDAEQERRRLFAALVQVFLRLAEQQPLLVVIEDLHWSDDISLEWLHLLMRRGTDHSLLLILTYRSDEPRPSLQHWLARLDRDRLAQELALEPLSPGEVEAMLRAIFALQQPVGREFLEAIYDLSQGNPFVVEELLKSLVSAGEVVYADGAWSRKPLARLRIPRSLHNAVQQRCAGLSADARYLLSLAAVAGRHVDFAVLREITDRDESDLLAPLKELVAAQLMIEASADQFAFRHALTRQVIYGDLLARERRALHQTIAETIERIATDAPDRHLGDLAYHFYEAGLWAKALEYAARAGQRALALYAPAAAIEHLTHAIEASHHLGQAPPLELYRARGQAHDALGDFAAAQADYEAALHLAEGTGDQPRAWQALLDLGVLWTGRDYDQAYEYLQRALELARAMDDPATLAHSLNRMGNWHANQEQPEPALRHHQEALAIFERLDDQQGLATTLDLLSMTAVLGGDASAAHSASERAVPLFRALGDRQGLAASLINLGTSGGTLYELDTVVGFGKQPGAIHHAEQALTLTREIGWRAGEAYILAGLGQVAGATGEFARGLDLLNTGLAIAEEIEHLQWQIQALYGLGAVHADLLAPAAARAYLERTLALAHAIHSLVWINHVSGKLASVLVAQGHLAEAEATLAPALGPTTPMQTLGQRQLWCAQAELALVSDDPAQALTILDRLYATATNLRNEADIPRLARLKCRALASLGQAAPAEALLRAAQTTARSHGVRPVLWRLHVSLATLYRGQDRREEAERETAAAHQIIDQLTPHAPEGPLRDDFARAAAATLPIPASRLAERATKDAFGGLTSREREVAARLTRGRTNREIADELFVSERTVEAHVGNILQKLGFTSRAQVASWAVERGLPQADT